MKRRIVYMVKLVILVIAWTISPINNCKAQEEFEPYYFDEEYVVFVFDIRAYAKALAGENALKVDFADLGIYDVAITGQFNNWSKKGWKMNKKDEFTFELRKKIQEFNDPFPMDFRYIINGRYIADPEGQITDPRQFEDDFLEEVYKVDLSVIHVADTGKTVFFLKGEPDAKEVILTGSFNNWNEHAIKMNKVENGWELRADLPPGRYEYKFIVDGKWTHDTANKEKVENEHSTFNSVLYVTVPVTFILAGYQDAWKVILTGSFVDWNEKKIEMTRTNGKWTATIPLLGGKHTYKFIVDGKWIIDPANPITEDDGGGNTNSVKFVH